MRNVLRARICRSCLLGICVSTTPIIEPGTTVRSDPTSGRGLHAVLRTVANKFAILLINAATGIITARALKPEGRGELAAMIIWPLFLTFVTTLGIPSSIIYMVKRHPEGQDAHVAAGFLMTLLLGVLAAAGGAGILPFWLGHQYNTSVILHAQLFLLATPLLALTQTGRAVLEANSFFGYSNELQIAVLVVTLLGLLLLLPAHRLISCLPQLSLTQVRRCQIFFG